MKLRTTAIGAFLLAACVAGCVSGSIRDDYIAGWQWQRDVYIHQFVQANFVSERAWTVRSAKLAKSESVDWADYARPVLAAATRSRAISEDRGRALVLERFLVHMRTRPAVQATVDWFAAEATDIRTAAKDSEDRTAALIDQLAGSAAMTEQLFQSVWATAATQGIARGRALQYADLRRTAALYFHARDETAVLPDDRAELIDDVDRLLDAADLRTAILRARQCRRAGDVVTCMPQAGGVPLSGDDEAEPSAPDAGTSTQPANEFAPNRPQRDIFDDPSGW